MNVRIDDQVSYRKRLLHKTFDSESFKHNDMFIDKLYKLASVER